MCFLLKIYGGVGRQYAKRLKQYGIHTALQFRNADEGWVRRNFSVNGVRLQRELKGEQCFPLGINHQTQEENLYGSFLW